MRRFLSYVLCLTGLMLAGSIRADERDRNKEYFKRLKEQQKRQDKHFREQRKRYEEQQREHRKRANEQYREGAKRQAERQREERKRYEEWLREQRNRFRGTEGYQPIGGSPYELRPPFSPSFEQPRFDDGGWGTPYSPGLPYPHPGYDCPYPQPFRPQPGHGRQ